MNREKLVFRPLTVSDISLLEEILTDDAGCFDPQQIEKFMRMDGNMAFGAILDNKIIGLLYGYALCQLCDDRPQFFVYSVAVHSNFRNRGYGSRFFQYVVDYCREKKYAEVFVPTDKGNVGACKVYEKAGGKSDFDREIIYVIKFAE